MRDRLTPEKAVEAARLYRGKGWRAFPLPVGQKKPSREEGWLKAAEKVTDDNVESLWADGENLGVILDSPLVDVDLDTDVAVRCAPYFLSNTTMKFRRKSNSGHAHWLYEVTDAEPCVFIDPVVQARIERGEIPRDDAKAMLLEIRANNGYTMMPPSVHPSGEQLHFAPGAKFPPDGVLYPDLKYRCSVTAASAFLVTYWQWSGGRNEATMALCGGLVRAEREGKIDPELVEAIVRCVVNEGGNEDKVSDFKLVERTRKRFEKIDSAKGGGQKEPKQPKGWKTLEKVLGHDGKTIVRQVREWLGILPRRAKRPPSTIVATPWADQIECEIDGNGNKTPIKCAHNVAAVLANDGNFLGEGLGAIPEDGEEERERGGVSVYYDEFRACKMVRAPLPWHPTNVEGYPRQWEDHDTLELQAYLLSVWEYNVGKEMTADGVDLHAGRHRVHEVRDYLRSLEWDGVDRLETMGPAYFGTADTLYERFVLRSWMISAVARVMKPGCQVDHCVILEGPQGIGKSTAARYLAVADDWFTDASIDMHNKSGSEVVAGAWIVELPELASIRKADVETVKTFISRRHDKYRPAYGRETISFPRSCVFVGTINPDDVGYLRDSTGARRFWPVACAKIDLDAIERDRDQLWAEAYAAYTRGEQWYPDKERAELVGVIEEEQQKRREEMDHEGAILHWIDDKFSQTNEDELVVTVAEALLHGVKVHPRSIGENRYKQPISRLLRFLKFKKGGQLARRYPVTIDGIREDVETRSVSYRISRHDFYALRQMQGTGERASLDRAMVAAGEHREEESVPF